MLEVTSRRFLIELRSSVLRAGHLSTTPYPYPKLKFFPQTKNQKPINFPTQLQNKLKSSPPDLKPPTPIKSFKPSTFINLRNPNQKLSKNPKP
jgi:hypothetical protein